MKKKTHRFSFLFCVDFRLKCLFRCAYCKHYYFFLRIYLSRSCCKRTQVVFVLIKREQPEPRIKIAIQECALKKKFHLYLSELRTSFLEDQTKNKNKETSNDKYAHVYRRPCDHCSLTSSFWSCLEFPYGRIAFFIIYFLLFL